MIFFLLNIFAFYILVFEQPDFSFVFHMISLQCVIVIWLDLASSRRRVNTSVQQTISVCTAHAATAVTASSQERWSLLWGARTIQSVLSAVSAGTVQQYNNFLQLIFTW